MTPANVFVRVHPSGTSIWEGMERRDNDDFLVAVADFVNSLPFTSFDCWWSESPWVDDDEDDSVALLAVLKSNEVRKAPDDDNDDDVDDDDDGACGGWWLFRDDERHGIEDVEGDDDEFDDTFIGVVDWDALGKKSTKLE